MIAGAQTQDNSPRDVQDKILDVLGPLCALHENFMLMQDSIENEEIILDKITVDAMFGCVKKAIMLVEDTSTQVSSKRREQVLTKLNLVLRSQTANTVADAKKAGKSFFSCHCPPKVPRAFSWWQRSIQSPLPRLLSPHIKLSDHKHIIQGQEQGPFTQSQGPYQPKPQQ